MSGSNSRDLVVTTVVQNQSGEGQAYRTFSPGDDVPDWAAEQMGDHCFAGGRPSDGPPPKSGAGSTNDAWAAYSAAQGVPVADDATRDSIIQSLSDAGKPVE